MRKTMMMTVTMEVLTPEEMVVVKELREEQKKIFQSHHCTLPSKVGVFLWRVVWQKQIGI
jgi:hypothetical protein